MWAANASVGNIIGAVMVGMIINQLGWCWCLVIPACIMAALALAVALYLPGAAPRSKRGAQPNGTQGSGAHEAGSAGTGNGTGRPLLAAGINADADDFDDFEAASAKAGRPSHCRRAAASSTGFYFGVME